jgi:hypothetical protein
VNIRETFEAQRNALAAAIEQGALADVKDAWKIIIAMDEMAGAYEQTERERDAARADAERYRFLRAHVADYGPTLPDGIFVATDYGTRHEGATLDDAVDAARAAARGED